MFCPKCKSILLPRFVNGKRVMGCSCGYTSNESTVLRTEVKREPERQSGALKEQQNMPITDATCPKCNHNKAHWWSRQTRAGDEPETLFFKCEKCKHAWREYK